MLEQDNLPSKLIGIYFSFFKLSIKKGEVDTKLMSALLTGVNRAFPFASVEPEQLGMINDIIRNLTHCSFITRAALITYRVVF